MEERLRGLDVAAALRPADPQAEQLAALTGLSEEKVRLRMAVLLSIMIELGSSLLLDVAAVAKREPVKEAMKGEGEAFTISSEPADTAIAEWARAALKTRRSASVRCTEAREAFERSVRAAGANRHRSRAFGGALPHGAT